LELGLPKESWRPNQREVIQEILDAFDSGIKFVSLAAPTGSGKSLIAAAVQKLLSFSGSGNSLVLTHTIQLQEQYRQFLPDAVVLKGRRNFLCELPAEHPARLGFLEEMTAETAPCADGQACDAKLDGPGGCGYYRQYWTAAYAPMVVTNYAYALRILQLPVMRISSAQGYRQIANPFRRPLLIADESHLLEQAVLESVSLRIHNRLLYLCGVRLPPADETQEVVRYGPRTVRTRESSVKWSEWARQSLPSVISALERIRAEQTSIIGLCLEDPSARNQKLLAEIRMKHRQLTALRDGMSILAELSSPEEWIIRRDIVYGKESGITARPLFGRTETNRLLWRHFDRVLLMSATPGDPKLESIRLDIPEDQHYFIEVPSIFPPERRPVYFWPVRSLSHRSTDEDWQAIAKAIAHIAQSGHWKYRKGLVHTASHRNARKLTEMLNALIPGRFFTHGESTTEVSRALKTFITSKEPLVMVTASMTTGVDIPYLIGWQVIAKVPYASLGDEIVAARRAFRLENGYPIGQELYDSEAQNAVIQAAGRAVRSVDDAGVTFILDANYARLYKRTWSPRFFREAFRELIIE
jgi:Rad3-related DNA helicase